MPRFEIDPSAEEEWDGVRPFREGIRGDHAEPIIKSVGRQNGGLRPVMGTASEYNTGVRLPEVDGSRGESFDGPRVRQVGGILGTTRIVEMEHQVDSPFDPGEHIVVFDDDDRM